MLETPHVVVAAAIATKIGNPALAIPLSFLSHFVLEKIPHWNPHLRTEKLTLGKLSRQSTQIVIADSLLSLTLGSFIASRALPDINHAIVILLSCFAAVLPDLIEAPYYFLNSHSDFIVNKWIPFKKSIQVDASPLPGLATQAVTILAALWWILT